MGVGFTASFAVFLVLCTATASAQRLICRDDNENCQSWADVSKYCSSDEFGAFMNDHCPVSCNLCTAADAAYDWSADDNIYVKSGKNVLLTGCSEDNRNSWVVKTFTTAPGYHFEVICEDYEVATPFDLKADYDGKSYKDDEWSAVIREVTEGKNIKLGIKFSGSAPGLVCSISSKYNKAKDPSFSCHCGKKNSDTERIVGGTMAGPNEIPWQIGTVWNKGGGEIGRNVHCGGTIISSRWIVSAAHCLNEEYFPRWAIMYGTNDFTVQKDKLIDVEELIVHPQYNTPSPWNNDIVLMKLKRPIKFSRTVSPACLPKPHKVYSGMNALISGWGLTTHEGSAPDMLKKVTIPMSSQRGCQVYWSSHPNQFHERTQLCVKVVIGDSSCQGDSGGPVVVKDGNNYDFVGIVSYGMDCANQYTSHKWPSTFAKVAAYLSFIRTHTANTPDDQSCPR